MPNAPDSHDFSGALGTPLALIQAPMAGSQDSALAIAAGAAGALGSLPAAMLDPRALDAQLARLRDAGHPYNVNFFAHTNPPADAAHEARWRARLARYYAELGLDPAQVPAGASRRPFDAQAAEVLQAFRPRVVSFHFGLPDPALLRQVKAMGSLVLSSATTLAEAQWLQAHGADAVIAQGLEAGGHRGHFLDRDVARQSGTLDLVRQLVPALRLPVIAAGGIGEAADVQAALQAGAAAVQVGTAFLLCPEATTSAVHRARLRDREAPTALTNLFSGGLARGLGNRLMHELGPVNDDAPPFPLASVALAPLRAKAEASGRDDFSPLWSGTNRRGCQEVPAGDIVRALAAGLAPDARVFHTQRVLPHPPQQVYGAFASAQQLARWWGPEGFTNRFECFDFRVGGRWTLVMQGPDGQQYPNENVFTVLEPDRRVVLRHDGAPYFTLTVELQPEGAGTRLHWTQRFDDAATARAVRHIVVPANEQNLDRLGRVLAQGEAR